MKSSDQLFQLIRSLSRSEKRGFRLFATRYGGPKIYLRLFDAIDAMEEWDEPELRRRLAGERCLRQLNVAKRYLYNQILASLRLCHAGATPRARLRQMLADIEILVEKGLDEQARRLQRAAIELAGRHEELLALIEAHGWTDRLERERLTSREKVEAAFAPMLDALRRHEEYLDVVVAERKVDLALLGDWPRTADAVAELERAVADLPPEDRPPGTRRAAIIACRARSTYHFGRHEYALALDQVERQIALMEEQPEMIGVRPYLYLGALNNQLILLKRLGRLERFMAVADKVGAIDRELPALASIREPRVRAEIFATLHMNLLSLYLGLRRSDLLEQLAHRIEQGLRTHARHLDGQVLLKFHHNLAMLHFDLGDLRRALAYNLLIVQSEPPGYARETYYHARLMHVVIHYELGNFDLLEYLIPSTYRYFRSRRIIHRFERVVLDLFGRLLRTRAGRPDLLRLFVETRERFASLTSDPLEADAFRRFQYLDWLDEKIAQLRAGTPGDQAHSNGGTDITT